ncbi:MAG: glycosyltransferase [Patescibacteria group bacterium]
MYNRTVIYVNFSQYDNTGRILDYLRETFATVIHFSFDHLRLKHGRKTNLLTIYQKGHQIKQTKLYSLRVPAPLLFPSLPIVGILMIFQTLRHTLRLRHFLSSPIFFTVNAYPALIGIMLKKLKIATSVHYWVWDFYPLKYPDWRMRLVRYLYLFFDTLAIHKADKLIFPNQRQLALRNAIMPIKNHFRIIPLGATQPINYRTTSSNILGFMGMIKESQGLHLLLNNLAEIFKSHPQISIEIIGSGPEEETLRQLAKPYAAKVKFYGFIEDQNRINRLVRRWFAGLAVYKPDKNNESYWGDPSKIKLYLSQGVPIITTNVTDFGILAKKHGFGKLIPYSATQMIKAIGEIHRQQKTFRKRALAFAQKFYYRNLYSPMFAEFKPGGRKTR